MAATRAVEAHLSGGGLAARQPASDLCRAGQTRDSAELGGLYRHVVRRRPGSCGKWREAIVQSQNKACGQKNAEDRGPSEFSPRRAGAAGRGPANGRARYTDAARAIAARNQVFAGNDGGRCGTGRWSRKQYETRDKPADGVAPWLSRKWLGLRRPAREAAARWGWWRAWQAF